MAEPVNKSFGNSITKTEENSAEKNTLIINRQDKEKL